MRDEEGKGRIERRNKRKNRSNDIEDTEMKRRKEERRKEVTRVGVTES